MSNYGFLCRSPLTHHVKQSSFAGVQQCYSYILHTHTHAHTKAIFFPLSSSTFPKFSSTASSTAAHIISRVTRRSGKHIEAFDCQQTLLSSFVILKTGTIHPTNHLQTFFFLLLPYTFSNVKLREMLVACPCSKTCVNQTSPDLTCSTVCDQPSIVDTQQLDNQVETSSRN